MQHVVHEHIIGQWTPVNGELRNRQKDAIDWFENSMPMKYVNSKLTMKHDDDAMWYWVGFHVGKAFACRGIVRIYQDGHVEWNSSYHLDEYFPDRSFLNPVDAVAWILLEPLHDDSVLT